MDNLLVDEPQLRLVDLGGLIDRINSVLSKTEAPIRKGNFEGVEPRKNPFLYRARDRERETLQEEAIEPCGSNGSTSSSSK